MEIVDYELFQVPPRWLFLRVETDTGLVGWGEPVVEGRARTVETADQPRVGLDPQEQPPRRHLKQFVVGYLHPAHLQTPTGPRAVPVRSRRALRCVSLISRPAPERTKAPRSWPGAVGLTDTFRTTFSPPS